MNQFKINQKVYFGRDNGKKTLGVIQKINLKSIKVKALEASGKFPVGTIWNVAPFFVQSLDGKDVVLEVDNVTQLLYNPFASMENKFLDILSSAYCGLSPENLSCDGEASASYVIKKRKELNAIVSNVTSTYFNVFGVIVTEDNLNSWEKSKREWENIARK